MKFLSKAVKILKKLESIILKTPNKYMSFRKQKKLVNMELLNNCNLHHTTLKSQTSMIKLIKCIKLFFPLESHRNIQMSII